MAGWISSKLKVAETLLQQIDQQAAESLRKGDKKTSDDELDLQIPVKTSGSVSLKSQLSSKSIDKNDDINRKSHSDSHPKYNASGTVGSSRDREKEVLKVETKPRASLTDSDWTELLSTPKQSGLSKSSVNSGSSGIRGLRKQGGKYGNNRVSGSGSVRKTGNGVAEKTNVQVVDGKRSIEDDPKDSISTSRVSSVGSDDKVIEGWELDEHSVILDAMDSDEVNPGTKSSSDVIGSDTGAQVEIKSPESGVRVPIVNTESNPNIVNEASREIINSDIKDQRRSTDLRGKGKATGGDDNHVPDDIKRASYSESDVESRSDSDSSSTSDSDDERNEEMRRRRQQILAAKAAAKAAEAIKDRENLVARLEGEKESLEKILEERAKQAALEASELQSTMMETMEAVDLEKQKHNHTRMEVLASLAKLETENAGLARSLASAQWNLQVEVNRVAEVREQIESMEAAHEELRRRIASTQQTGASPSNLVASKGIQLEKEMLEAEYAFVTDKIARLRDKANQLEEDIAVAKKEMENPSEVEVELKGRLGQMTDHLIQKQAQVEALSSEKAMLLFRIETVSKLLEENKSLVNMVDSSGTSHADLELGAWEHSQSKFPPMFKDKIHTGKQHLWSFLRQLDAIYVAGAVFLSRNPTAKLWSLVYVVCLHFWVLYIFFSYSWSSSETRSGAVVSIENLNNSGAPWTHLGERSMMSADYLPYSTKLIHAQNQKFFVLVLSYNLLRITLYYSRVEHVVSQQWEVSVTGMLLLLLFFKLHASPKKSSRKEDGIRRNKRNLSHCILLHRSRKKLMAAECYRN